LFCATAATTTATTTTTDTARQTSTHRTQNKQYTVHTQYIIKEHKYYQNNANLLHSTICNRHV
jgi:hypothetical protein